MLIKSLKIIMKNTVKNILAEQNAEMGKHQYSKKTDHL
ncbi:hypothetical protein CVD28_25650 [Bacillus sp. M6-12]|nr:hypothetical protein CVD28_25650 [Bacillus sp. M6-12]